MLKPIDRSNVASLGANIASIFRGVGSIKRNSRASFLRRLLLTKGRIAVMLPRAVRYYLWHRTAMSVPKKWQRYDITICTLTFHERVQ